jgi:hypothetical protein
VFLWLPCKNTAGNLSAAVLLTNLHGKQNGHRLRSGLPRTLTKPYVVSGQAKTYCPPSEVGFDSWFAVYKAAWCGTVTAILLQENRNSEDKAS